MLLHIEVAERTAEARSERIDGVLQAGSVVHALAVGVARHQSERACRVTQAGLERVIPGVGDRRNIGVGVEGRS